MLRNQKVQKTIRSATKSFSTDLSGEEQRACGMRALWKCKERFSREGFVGYFRRAVVNECINELREKANNHIAFPADLNPQYEPDLDKGLVWQEVAEAVRTRLSDYERELLDLYFWKEMSLTNIARQVDAPRSTVFDHLQQAIDVLRLFFGVRCSSVR